MKSKVNVVILTLSLCFVAGSEALPQAPQNAVAAADDQTAVSKESFDKSEHAAVIQPCYRWPHPCD